MGDWYLSIAGYRGKAAKVGEPAWMNLDWFGVSFLDVDLVPFLGLFVTGVEKNKKGQVTQPATWGQGTHASKRRINTPRYSTYRLTALHQPPKIGGLLYIDVHQVYVVWNSHGGKAGQKEK